MPVPGLVPNIQGQTLSISYDADVDNVDLFADVGSPSYPVHVFVQVADAATVGAALAPGQGRPNPAMTISGFAAGSTVYILNRGVILGGGGIGGGGDRHGGAGVGSFRGGGGGGGAGSSSQGGPRYPESDPDAGNTDGAAGTTTTGGAGGVSDYGGDIPNQSFVAGDPPQNGGHAIVCTNVNLIIDNAAGEIFPGGAGGDGGFLDGSLPGGANDGVDGDDLASSLTEVTVAGDEPSAVYFTGTGSGYSLTWIGGDTYPAVGGYVREIA